MGVATTQHGYPFLFQHQLEAAFAALDRNHAHQRGELLPLLRRDARGSPERGVAAARSGLLTVELNRSLEGAQGRAHRGTFAVEAQLKVSQGREFYPINDVSERCSQDTAGL
jgi:hypothetical protein